MNTFNIALKIYCTFTNAYYITEIYTNKLNKRVVKCMHVQPYDSSMDKKQP